MTPIERERAMLEAERGELFATDDDSARSPLGTIERAMDRIARRERIAEIDARLAQLGDA